MRQLVFRILAGILSLAFGIFLTIGDTSGISLRVYFYYWIIGIGFGLFAILGTQIAESFLARVFGMEVTNKNPPPSETSDASIPPGPRMDDQIR